MKYVVLESFAGDYRRLSDRERAMFRRVLRAFARACDAFVRQPSTPFPAALRVKPVEAAPGIFEMTWSFSGPDGRATFEWTRVDGEQAIRWRRIGSHRILREP